MTRLTHSSNRPSQGHSGGLLPPRPGGGDDGHSGRGHGDSMPDYGERLRQARRALAVFMTPVLMLFVSFTVVYLVRRGSLNLDLRNSAPTWVPVRLPWALLLVNTVVLILSSLTMELARRAIAREAALAPVKLIPGVSLGKEPASPWLGLTAVLGLSFISGQLLAWRQLSIRGFHLMGGTSSSFVYVLTAMHGLHLAGGTLAVLFANVWALLRRPVDSRRLIVDIASWYWHCMTALWIYIIALLSLAAR